MSHLQYRVSQERRDDTAPPPIDMNARIIANRDKPVLDEARFRAAMRPVPPPEPASEPRRAANREPAPPPIDMNQRICAAAGVEPRPRHPGFNEVERRRSARSAVRDDDTPPVITNESFNERIVRGAR